MTTYKKNYENYLKELSSQILFLADFQITCIENSKPDKEQEKTLRHINQSLLQLRKKINEVHDQFKESL